MIDTLIQVPKAPSKYDIIPIHNSDRGTFKLCRRRWDWSSPMRNNLMTDVEQSGVYMPFWFGSGIHWALKMYYDPALKHDLVETFKTWWDVQWNGGIISGDWLETVYDRNPRAGTMNRVDDGVRFFPFPNNDIPVLVGSSAPVVYKVKGLQDLIPMAEVEREDFESHLQLGVGMLTFYREWCKLNDNFTVIAAEHTFSVPIYDPVHDSIMRRVDPRDGVEKEVHLRGTQDAIVQGNETGKYGILEHKSAVSIDEDYFTKLDKDDQCTNYMFAAQVEANLYNLPYKNIEFVLYNALRKAFPRKPTITTRGLVSIDRKNESTTYEMLMETIRELGMEEYAEAEPKLASYIEYVRDQGDSQFIIRQPVFRNDFELRACGERAYMEADDMLDPKIKIYPNPTGSRSCLLCPFRAPCIAKDDGSDWDMMLNDMFIKNWSR